MKVDAVIGQGNLKKQTAYLICMIFFLLLVNAGCRSDSEEGKLSKTDMKRISAHPKAVQFLMNGDLAFKNGVYNAALILADSAEYYAPELADVHFLRGMIFTEILRFDEAKSAYEKVLALDPDYPGCWLNLGNTAFRKGKIREALKCYKKEKKFSTRSSIMLQIGRVYTELGKVDSALQAYQQAIALDSSYATTYMRLGQIYKDDGELEKALEYSRKGLNLDPDNLNYQYVVGSILLLTGQAKEAVDYLTNVVQEYPWHYWAHYNLGQALVHSGRTNEAQRYLTAAESLQVTIKKLQEWRKMVENNPDQQGIWVNYGSVLSEAGRIDDAIHAYNVALSLKPQISPEQYLYLNNDLAILYMTRGDTAQAIGRFLEILQQDSTYADVWLNLGVAYANSGRIEDARHAWKNTLKYAPNDSMAKANLKRLAD